MYNQIWITSQQYKKLKDVSNYGVRLIITDSPLLLGLIYCNNVSYKAEFDDLLYKLNDEFENVNVFVRRVKKYNPSGRLQNETQSDEISARLRELVKFDYEIDGNKESQEEFAELIYQKYKHLITI